jgi:hypothetical protein
MLTVVVTPRKIFAKKTFKTTGESANKNFDIQLHRQRKMLGVALLPAFFSRYDL